MASNKVDDCSRLTSAELLDVLYAILDGVQQPMHYKTLMAALDGIVDISHYARPADSLYSLMQSDIRRRQKEGTQLRFAFMGEGVFASHRLIADLGQDALDELAITPPDKARKQLPVVAVSENAMCGDCTFIAFEGFHAGVQVTGYCGLEASGRHIVHAYDKRCHGWRTRTERQRSVDRNNKLLAQECVNKINGAFAKARRAEA